MTEEQDAKGAGEASDEVAANDGGADSEAVDYAPAEAPKDAALPLLYEQPQPLTPDRHGDKSLVEGPDKKLADKVRAANSVPLNLIEFGLAVRHYPIVFTQADPPLPVAVLGLRNDENLFMGADASWAADTYVPAYIRRHPFIFMTGPDKEQYVLCIDESSELLKDGTDRPLFTDGKPSEIADSALKFCTAYQQQHEVTRVFGEELIKNNLLVPNRAEVTLKSGEKLGLGGFRVIEEARLNTLSDEIFLDWRKKGWLPAIYAHLIASGNWAALANRVVKED